MSVKVINGEGYYYEEGSEVTVDADGKIVCAKGKVFLTVEGSHGVAATDDATVVGVADMTTVQALSAKAKIVAVGDGVKKIAYSAPKKAGETAGSSKGTGSSKFVMPTQKTFGFRTSK